MTDIIGVIREFFASAAHIRSHHYGQSEVGAIEAETFENCAFHVMDRFGISHDDPRINEYIRGSDPVLNGYGHDKHAGIIPVLSEDE